VGYNIRSYTRIIFFLFALNGLSQSFSEKALIGKGELQLVGDNIKLQPEVYDAFEKMQAAALQEGINIQIVSGYRSFERQKQIWNKKYNTYISNGLKPSRAIKKIIEYSTIPGTSRHHWGTEIDVIDGSKKTPKNILTEENFEYGVYKDLKKWMDNNAEKFGFYLVYTKIKTRNGFKYEPWHYSYKPLSSIMFREYLALSFKKLIIKTKVNGSSKITSRFIQNYYTKNLLDINPKLK
jgi:LAS superfamily LD-carboxypeptidase LdcB